MEASLPSLAFEVPARSHLFGELVRLAGLSQRVLGSDVAVVYMWEPHFQQPTRSWAAGDEDLEPLLQRAAAPVLGAGEAAIDGVAAIGLGASLVAPIAWEGSPVGALCVASREARRWSERERGDLADLAALVVTELRMLSLARDLEVTSARCERSDAALRLRDVQLTERLKEQRCLYAVSAALRRPEPVADLLREAMARIPAGWAEPRRTWARLDIDGDVWLSPGFRSGRHRASAPIEIAGQPAGRLEVHVDVEALDDDTAFLPEERRLLDELAAIVGTALTRRRAEQALARSEAAAQEQLRFQAHLLDVVEQSVIATDRDGRITFWNRHATKLHGWTAEEARGRPMHELVLPPEIHANYQRAAARCNGGHSFTTEVEGIDRSGQRLALQVWMVPICGEDDTVVGTVSVATDIRERKELEARLARGQRLESVGRLAGGIAHDFNNILTSIGGFARMLLERDPDPAARGDLDEITAATDRAGALTHKLLAFSRQQVLSPRVVDLSRVITGMQEMLTPLIGEHITLETLVDPALRPVRVDVTQLEQVIMNLVINARDAMPDGGRVLVETANVDITPVDAERSSGHLEPGPHVVLRVRDRGHGMDAATMARIFDPFFTTKPACQSSGLGLSTVFGIVIQSRGHLEVDSQVGRGSTFCVYLPAVRDAVEDRPDTPPAIEDPERRTETLLVVEDDPPVRRLIIRILKTAGYQVLEASDGAEALRMLIDDGAQVDLVVSDVVMPRLGGRELVERLRSISPGTRTLLMSGYTDDEVLRQGVDGRRCAFIGKPFRPVELIQRIRQLLDQTEQT